METRTCSAAAAAVLCLFITACGDERLVAPGNEQLAPPNHDLLTMPATTCAGIKAANPGAGDGEYVVRSSHREFTLYCVMSTSPARDYLTLPAGGDNNFSNYAPSGGGGVFTRFSKIHINATTLAVDVNDLRFASSSGLMYHCGRSWDPVYSMPYGTAMTCSGAADARAKVDLTGTDFSWGETIWFGAYGNRPIGTRSVSADRKTWTLTGGGYAGWMSYAGAYNPFNPGGELWKLTLTYTGPFVNQAPVIDIQAQPALEGSATVVSALANDPDGDMLAALSWSMGDGTIGTGPVPTSWTYADDGVYTITVTARDQNNATTTGSATVTVTNVAPVVGAISGAELLAGETYHGGGMFADPGSDVWTAAADYGFGFEPAAVIGKTFTLSHVYETAGTFTLKVAVSDDDGGVGIATTTVVVLSPAQSSEKLGTLLQEVVTSGGLAPADAKPLTESVKSVFEALQKDNREAALGKLGAFDNKLNALRNSKRISDADHALLMGYSARLRNSIKG